MTNSIIYWSLLLMRFPQPFSTLGMSHWPFFLLSLNLFSFSRSQSSIPQISFPTPLCFPISNTLFTNRRKFPVSSTKHVLGPFHQEVEESRSSKTHPSTCSLPFCFYHSVTKSCSALTPWTIANQVPLFMGFPRQDYWSGCHFPLQGIFPSQGSIPCLLIWQTGSLLLSHREAPPPLGRFLSNGSLQ